MPTRTFCDNKCLLSCYCGPRYQWGLRRRLGDLRLPNEMPAPTHQFYTSPHNSGHAATYSSLKQCPYLIERALSLSTPGPQGDGRWPDLASKDKMVPQKPDAGAGPDLASCVGPYKPGKHKLDIGESITPLCLLKVLMCPEFLKGRVNIYWGGGSLDPSTESVLLIPE